MCYCCRIRARPPQLLVLWCNVSTAPGRDPWIWDAGKQERTWNLPSEGSEPNSECSQRAPPATSFAPGQAARVRLSGKLPGCSQKWGALPIVRFRDFLERPRLSGKSRLGWIPYAAVRNALRRLSGVGREYEFPADTGRCLRRFISGY